MFPVGIGLSDPRSQKRDLGHPSISPFECCRGFKLCRFSPDSLSASRAAPTAGRGGRDDKGNDDIQTESDCWPMVPRLSFRSHADSKARTYQSVPTLPCPRK